MIPVAYGLDYGTTNSVIAAAWPDGRVEPVPLSGDAAPMPSLVYLNRDGARAAGEDAARAFLNHGGTRTYCSRCEFADECRQYRRESACLDSRLFAQLKSDLADDHLTTTHGWGTDFSLPDLVAVTFKRMKRIADRQTGGDVRRVVLGRPVRFVDADPEDPEQAQVAAEVRLRVAAEEAGFEEIEILPEPQAAIAPERLDEGLILCADFGGGTFDVALVERMGNEAEVLALAGAPVGGENIDAELFRRFVGPVLGFGDPVDDKGRLLPARVRHGLCSRAGLKRLLVQPDIAPMLLELAGRGHRHNVECVIELLYGGQAWALHRAVEVAKIGLTTETSARVRLVRPPHLDIDVTITRDELAQILDGPLVQVTAAIGEALRMARVRARDIDLVVCTGGSSQIPAFEAALRAALPTADIVRHDAFTAVANGLAEWGRAEWVDRSDR